MGELATLANQIRRNQNVRVRITDKIATQLIVLMKEHIGISNAIDSKDLFHKLFKFSYDDNMPSHWMLWEFTKKAMHNLRARSNCFISSARVDVGDSRQYIYFVVKDTQDADIYINTLDKLMKRMEYMQKRCARSVIEKWHKQEWQIEQRKNKEVEYK